MKYFLPLLCFLPWLLVSSGALGQLPRAAEHSQPERLRQALLQYQAMEATGLWTAIRPDTCLSPGAESSYLLPLRTNLLLTGDLPPGQNSSLAVLDEPLVQAVRRFQDRHGLDPDGKIGEQTLTALNVPLQTRIEQLRLNQVRWLDFRPDSSRPFVFVNIPDYSLQVVEKGKTVLQMRVIVGKSTHQTLIFNDSIRQVVLLPAWYVPASIARQEILPMLKRNPGYLAKNNMKLFRVERNKRVEVNPASIAWASVRPEKFNFLVVQSPGPRNSLGQIKFLFPNEHHIYLHDTPEKSLFQNRFRTYSHGCVRVERPLDLAQYLLRRNPGWGRSQIQSWLAQGSPEKEINLAQPVPVRLGYYTAWVADDGAVHFRPDVYGHDFRKSVFLKPPLL